MNNTGEDNIYVGYEGFSKAQEVDNIFEQLHETKFENEDTRTNWVSIENFMEIFRDKLIEMKVVVPDINIARYEKKFYFTEEYPDIVDVTNVLQFEITKRKTASLSSKSAPPFNGRNRYRPFHLGTFEDSDGSIYNELMMIYDNEVNFNVWSDRLAEVEAMCRVIENVNVVYYDYLRQFVPVFIYIGRDRSTQAISEITSKRYFSRTLTFFIRTNEYFKVRQNKIQDISIEVINEK